MDWFLIVVVAVVALMMLVANIYLIILYQVRQQRTTDTVKRETGHEDCQQPPDGNEKGGLYDVNSMM